MERVILEGTRHFERVARDLKGKDVVIEIKKIEDAEAFYRALCTILGREPKRKFDEEKVNKYWNLLEAMLKKYNLSVKDVSFTLLKEGLKKYLAYGYDVVDVVREIEEKITQEASKYLRKFR